MASARALGGDVAGGAMGAMPLAVQNMLKAIQNGADGRVPKRQEAPRSWAWMESMRS